MAVYMPLAVYTQESPETPSHFADAIWPFNLRDVVVGDGNSLTLNIAPPAGGNVHITNNFHIAYQSTNVVNINGASTQYYSSSAQALQAAEAAHRRRIYHQVRTLSPFPGLFEHGHGIHVGPDGFIRPAQGSIAAILEFPFAIFVRPDGHPSGLAARMFYQLRFADLTELERAVPTEETRASVRVDGHGHGLWLAPDGSLKFGFGIVTQVFRDVVLAQLNTMLEPDALPSSGFVGADPNPTLRPDLRFR
ncbi:uncharacterized protein DSM5745_05977 [Aspergillus mulundensis]|uniref:Uncharacterized protein n=1 Tax=Aspergillus mulundensis TaxID=1810919 RepID=A0A3D8RYL0_9EURO|nr:hypothetical protein DSM5745_05977 [Aspergillus mulundensis]RDW79125.1 hypothetical protein DSM5745_05977 [Aspergillus mulundensis]